MLAAAWAHVGLVEDTIDPLCTIISDRIMVVGVGVLVGVGEFVGVGVLVGMGHTPQSAGQLPQVSPALHVPLGHVAPGVGVGVRVDVGQAPQSAGQLPQVSPALHVPLGHVTGGVRVGVEVDVGQAAIAGHVVVPQLPFGTVPPPYPQ